MFTEVPVDKLVVCNEAVTREGKDDIEELAQDISERGLIQPLCVRLGDKGIYEVYAGRRRLHALKHLGVKKVICKVREHLDDIGVKTESLAENLHRRSLNASEKYSALKNILSLCDGDVDEAAKKTGMTKSTIRSYLKMRENLDESIIKKLDEGDIPMDAAIALSKCDKDEQKHVLEEVGADAKEIKEKISKPKIPKVPWIPNDKGEPVIIPPHLFAKVWQVIR